MTGGQDPRYAIVIVPLPYSGLRLVNPKSMTLRKATGVAADSPGYFGGQNQPVPPRNQTVSLTCRRGSAFPGLGLGRRHRLGRDRGRRLEVKGPE